MKMKLQRSKDTFCDYLLAKMWQSFLTNSQYDETCDFDLGFDGQLIAYRSNDDRDDYEIEEQ